jgi:hypothetical protein
MGEKDPPMHLKRASAQSDGLGKHVLAAFLILRGHSVSATTLSAR